MYYRAEIDGLRALAVTSVILFHAGIPGFTGGFIGVDVFFVISGFLITQIISKELTNGTFSIWDFYERRARRILPALFFVMVCCIPFAWLWMTPDQLINFSQSLAMVSAFSSNYLFYFEEGYFSQAAELKPLLHTWSLGVEEQFYVFFPFLMTLLWKYFQARIAAWLGGIALASLAICEITVRLDPALAFYSIHTRAWELMAGAIAAVYLYGNPLKQNSLYAGCGLLLVLSSIFVFDESHLFPSAMGLAPIAGVVLILMFGGKEGIAGKILCTGPVVALGLISYSAYLWHQPLMSFARISSLEEPSLLMMGSLAASSFALATLSYKFIEKPFRSQKLRSVFDRKFIFTFAILGTITIASIGVLGHLKAGFPSRVPTIAKDAIENSMLDYRGCHYGKPPQSIPQAACFAGKSIQEPDVLFLGDSHSAPLAEVVSSHLAKRGIDSYRASYNSCPPILGLTVHGDATAQGCATFLSDVFDFADENRGLTLVLTARFPLYLDGYGFDNKEGGVEFRPPTYADISTRQNSELDDMERRDRFLAHVAAELKRLSKAFNIILVYPIPEAGWNVRDRVVYLTMRGEPFDGITTSYDVYRKRTQKIAALFDELVDSSPNIVAVRPDLRLCNNNRCLNTLQNQILYRDDDHLSKHGALMLTELFEQALIELDFELGDASFLDR